jgi:GntR family transcriptional regulator
MEIDKKSPLPIYYQLEQAILDKISHGEWSPGSAISSERELSESLGISRMTIRQAISELVKEGVLYTEKGRGTFVTQPRIEQTGIMSFTEAATSKGLEPVTVVSGFRIVSPEKEILHKLSLRDDEKTYHIQRIRMAGTLIIGIEEIFLPSGLYNGLSKEDLTGSLYKILSEKYGYTVDRMETSFEAIIPEENENKLFKVNVTIPLLRISGVNISSSGRKLFYERSIYRSDKYILNFKINRI